MRNKCLVFASLATLIVAAGSACGSANSPEPVAAAPDAGAGGDGGTGGSPDTGSELPPLAPANIALGQPERVISGAARLVDVTTDDHAIYRLGNTLYAAKLEPNATPIAIAESAVIVSVIGRVAFAWTNVDYTTNLGDLTIWTAEHGPRVVGPSFFREGTVAASPDGSRILYLANPTELNVDLMTTDTAVTQVETLVAATGRATNTTCGARFGFAGQDRIVATWCSPESWEAKLEMFSPDPATVWQRVTIATDGQSWSADQQANRIFFTTRSSRARVFEAGQTQPVDTSVAWGVLLPDGSSAIYLVGDQLRRTPLPEIDPVPIIPNDFRYLVAFDPSYEWVLFSKQVSYEAGTRRDLWLSRTTEYNPNPEMIVGQPTATVSRSAFTEQGSHFLWNTEIDANGSGTLHARRVLGGPERNFVGVDTSVAAGDAVVVFSDARTPPPEHPIVADLKLVDLATDTEPLVIQRKIEDGRNFGITVDRTRVVYSLPASPEAPDQQALYVQRIRP